MEAPDRTQAPTRVYLAARFEERERLAASLPRLRAAGVDVTSRWLASTLTPTREVYREHGARIAAEDLEDILAADVFVSVGAVGGRGGRHVEFGYALAHGKRLLLVGEPENVFHYLPGIEILPPDVSIDQIAAAILGLQWRDLRICAVCGGHAVTRCFLDLPYVLSGSHVINSFCSAPCRAVFDDRKSEADR